MTRSIQDAILNIRKHASDVQNEQQDQMEVDASDQAAFEARLDQTVKELQARVKEQQAALDKLRATSTSSVSQGPSANPRESLRQMRIIKAAYENLTPSQPYLPAPGSLLPAILATRVIQETIVNTKAAIIANYEKLASTTKRLEQEEANLRDANALTFSLENRIERLRVERAEKSQKPSSQIAKELLKAKQKRKQDYERETTRLRSALDDFVNQYLAGLLAAEELGGPVVGDLMDVDDEVLAAGFSHLGKPKRSGTVAKADDAMRQRRIDETWSQAKGGQDEEPLSEREAAAEQVGTLLEELFEASIGDSASGAYVQLVRDSAAARFLVRARVAQFHPKDARRLRLVDFGRELDD